MKLQKQKYSDWDHEKCKSIIHRYASLKPFENDVIEELLINLDSITWKIPDDDLLEVGKLIFNLFMDGEVEFGMVENGIELKGTDKIFYYTKSMLREDKVILIDIKILDEKEKNVFLDYRAEQNSLN